MRHGREKVEIRKYRERVERTEETAEGRNKRLEEEGIRK
jgi:hypothetical protein